MTSEIKPDYREYACEAVGPIRTPRLEAQQQIHRQGRPELPADGLLGMPEEVADLQGLFDLFEEDRESTTRNRIVEM